MKIKKFRGVITAVRDLSETAKEVEIAISEDIDFIPGSFVNVFMTIDGEIVRRAFSIVSYDNVHHTITLAVRLSPEGVLTPLFWKRNMIGEQVELMGPLGLNTADKMHHRKIYLFGFGVGAGVVRSLADHFSGQKTIEQLVIMTGSKYEEDILYKAHFDGLARISPYVSTSYVVSRNTLDSKIPKGYLQDHIGGMDFNNADVYVCGQEAACVALTEKIKHQNPVNCSFFIEGFH